MNIIATVAIPAEVGLLLTGAGVVLLTTVTMIKHNDMRIADIQSVGLRPHRSEKKRMKMPTMMNFSAPYNPVMSRS